MSRLMLSSNGLTMALFLTPLTVIGINVAAGGDWPG